MRRGTKWGTAAVSLLLLLTTACGSNNVKDEAKAQAAEPGKAIRVIATSVTYPDFLYSLGVTPVAAENYHTEFPSYFKGTFKDVIPLGGNLNLEGILSAAPDLIIGPKWRDEKSYDQLSKIAQTKLMPERDNWRDELRDIAGVLDKQDKAEEVIRDFDEHMKASKAKLQAVAGDETFIYMRIMASEAFVMGERSSRGKIIHGELGLKPVAAYPAEEESIIISLEVLPEYNPDHIILQVDGGDDGASAQKLFDSMESTSVWKSLKAVKANHVYKVGDKEWMNFGFSPVATVEAVDEIVDSITQ
ncbi:ABC transporter substrate-binding protein [Paenibacillus tritici]|uniref:ABC transporter substrate-binding protein n=1 Tax=Paenibacillus tritici TaxID=1873425 RepID=A0ABX2DR10_9BACL|nr:ABC transporter substrate-binding protein [Paenibacillus tritici]NQX46607.1 ABC transporter substrate-binding protein [Paenibacillus tritici]